MEQNPKVKYWKDDRYAIFDEDTGAILDDANGYGYKDAQKAHKAMWWKFNGGKEKVDHSKKLAKDWIKEGNNQKIFNELNSAAEDCFKEIAYGESTLDDIVEMVEERNNIKIPDFVIKFFKNN